MVLDDSGGEVDSTLEVVMWKGASEQSMDNASRRWVHQSLGSHINNVSVIRSRYHGSRGVIDVAPKVVIWKG